MNAACTQSHILVHNMTAACTQSHILVYDYSMKTYVYMYWYMITELHACSMQMSIPACTHMYWCSMPADIPVHVCISLS